MADGLDHLDENRLSIDRDLRIFWQEIREGNRLRNQKMKAQLTEAARILADENIPVVVLKGGCELVQPSTQKFHRRFIGDLDLLVAKADLSKAMSALQASGYEDAYEDDEFFHSPDHHDTPLFNRRYPAAIEMHKAIGGKGGEQFLPADEFSAPRKELRSQISGFRPGDSPRPRGFSRAGSTFGISGPADLPAEHCRSGDAGRRPPTRHRSLRCFRGGRDATSFRWNAGGDRPHIAEYAAKP